MLKHNLYQTCTIWGTEQTSLKRARQVVDLTQFRPLVNQQHYVSMVLPGAIESFISVHTYVLLRTCV